MRACCVTQHPLGFLVQPASHTRRLARYRCDAGPGPDGRGEVVFQCGAGLYLHDLHTGRTHRVEVTMPDASRRVPPRTVDASRNNVLVAVLTLGEGWHNNHHHYQSSANQGFFWWEIDISYYLIRFFSRVGLVWDVRRPSAKALRHDTLELKAGPSHTPDGPGPGLRGLCERPART